MLATTPAGDAYTCAELESISKSAGFARVELAPPAALENDSGVLKFNREG
jgi:hypothetical protein